MEISEMARRIRQAQTDDEWTDLVAMSGKSTTIRLVNVYFEQATAGMAEMPDVDAGDVAGVLAGVILSCALAIQASGHDVEMAVLGVLEDAGA